MRFESKEAIRLAKEGIAPCDIAHRLGIAKTSVHSALRYARTKGEDIPLFSTRPPAAGASDKNGATTKPEADTAPSSGGPLPHIVVPNRLYALLAREAERRGKTPVETAQRLLEDALLGGVRS